MPRYSLKVNILTGFILNTLALILLILSWNNQSFSTWYAVSIYPIFPRVIGRLTALFPFSVFEVILVVCFLLFILWIVKTSLAGPKLFFNRLKRASLWTLNIFGTFFLMFVLTAGINYNRESFADHIGITVSPSSVYELEGLFLLLVEHAHEISAKVATDSTGHFVLNSPDTKNIGIMAMKGLNDKLGGINTYLPRAKVPLISKLMLYFGVSGFYSPWTLEAHYNDNDLALHIPFVICHELSHISSYMKENEANFIAYLACHESENIDFQYSAVYIALNSTLSALAKITSREHLIHLYKMMPEQVIRDRDKSRKIHAQYEGKVAEISSKVNDTYLRANRQKDGVQSYGQIVDLLLAYYKSEITH